MSKPARPAPHRDENHSPFPVRHRADAGNTRPLLARILDTPHLARVVPQLHPDVLYRVVQRCGLEDCAPLIALATPAQLTGMLDIDLWHSARPGQDDQLDVERFGLWLEVLLESGAETAARLVAGIDVALVTAALAPHVRVFDPAALVRTGEQELDDVPTDNMRDVPLTCDIGGFRIVARRADAWDAIVAVLGALEEDHRDAFDQLLGGCRRLSNSAPEIDGLDNLLTDVEQAVFDVALDREHRRERQGHLTPAEARAFLVESRQPRERDRRAPRRNPVAVAYFRNLDEIPSTGTEHAAAGRAAAADSPRLPDGAASAAAALLAVLADEGVIAGPPRALLEAPREATARLASVRRQLESLHRRAPDLFVRRSQELAFLANTLLAGCSIQGRPFTVVEASDAAIAVCNLGLELWFGRAADLPDAFLESQDFVEVFQVGWSALHQQVCLHVGAQLIDALEALDTGEQEMQGELGALRVAMTMAVRTGEPWRARDALDVLMPLDMLAWATVVGLVAECPVVHAAMDAPRRSGIRTVDASAYEFIAEHRQIRAVHAFMAALPATLRGDSPRPL